MWASAWNALEDRLIADAVAVAFLGAHFWVLLHWNALCPIAWQL